MQISRTPTPALDLQGVEVRRPESVDAAVALLDDLGPDAAPLAGATWVMRAAQLGRSIAPVQVALAGVRDLPGISVSTRAVDAGALATHAQLAAVDAGPAYEAVRRAGAISAFPAVRHMATLGGNVATIAFSEADLVPALLAVEATVRVAFVGGRAEFALADYLPIRRQRPASELIVSLRIPLTDGRASAFERLTVRGGGEYAVASVSVSVDRAADGTVTAARVVPGSVEQTARVLPGASAALLGSPLGDDTIEAAAGAAGAEVEGRDGLDAPGWYRAQVLPVLVRRALRSLT
jgi:carbon-monoxide dehydrogenase medium subunit